MKTKKESLVERSIRRVTKQARTTRTVKGTRRRKRRRRIRTRTRKRRSGDGRGGVRRRRGRYRGTGGSGMTRQTPDGVRTDTEYHHNDTYESLINFNSIACSIHSFLYLK